MHVLAGIEFKGLKRYLSWTLNDITRTEDVHVVYDVTPSDGLTSRVDPQDSTTAQ